MGEAIVLSVDATAQSVTVDQLSFDRWAETDMKRNGETRQTDMSDGQPEAKPATPTLASPPKRVPFAPAPFCRFAA